MGAYVIRRLFYGIGVVLGVLFLFVVALEDFQIVNSVVNLDKMLDS